MSKDGISAVKKLFHSSYKLLPFSCKESVILHTYMVSIDPSSVIQYKVQERVLGGRYAHGERSSKG